MTPITQFYEDRTIFVTGGTGFMGKVFLEKVIRSVPTIKRVYVLMRPKKGMTPQERVKKMISNVPFTFNNISKENLEKIVAITGDITKDDFGMTDEDKRLLIEEVSVVFHLAAAIRMDLSLKDAVIHNTLSTWKLLQFCTKIKNLVSVIHLSTAYCNIEISYMEEKVYPTKVNPYTLMDMVQWMDDECLQVLGPKLIRPHPNTYTFTKRLSEILVSDMGKQLPVAIVRPSIVLPSLREPHPGWVDSFNGPIGLLIAAGKGVLRTALVDKNITPQVIPVDIAINGLIIGGYHRATTHYDEAPVFNASQSEKYQMPWGTVLDHFRGLVSQYPFKKMLWYPSGDVTTNYYLNQLYMMVFHMIPAYFIDFLLLLFLQKPFLVNVQKRIYLASKVLEYFAVREWKFDHKNALKVANSQSEEDKEIFYADLDNIDIVEYLNQGFFGARKFCAKEDLNNMKLYRFQFQMFRLLDIAGKLFIAYWFMKFVIYVGNFIFSI